MNGDHRNRSQPKRSVPWVNTSDDEQERKRKTPLKAIANGAQNGHIHAHGQQNGLDRGSGVGLERKHKKRRLGNSMLGGSGSVGGDTLGPIGPSSCASQNPYRKIPEIAASLQEQRKELPIANGA